MGSAYAEGLRLLAGRELSEAQVRERLARRQFEPAQIDEAVERLRGSGALDDLRVATAVARTEALVRNRGRFRIRRQLAAIGIDDEVAARALDEVFSAIDEGALLERALARRLHGPRATITAAAEFRRLHQHLVRLGFDPEAVTRLLKSRARREAGTEDDA